MADCLRCTPPLLCTPYAHLSGEAWLIVSDVPLHCYVPLMPTYLEKHGWLAEMYPSTVMYPLMPTNLEKHSWLAEMYPSTFIYPLMPTNLEKHGWLAEMYPSTFIYPLMATNLEKHGWLAEMYPSTVIYAHHGCYVPHYSGEAHVIVKGHCQLANAL